MILDLTARLDVAVTVARLKALVEPPKSLAFGPHVHEAKLAGASAAGCDTISHSRTVPLPGGRDSGRIEVAVSRLTPGIRRANLSRISVC